MTFLQHNRSFDFTVAFLDQGLCFCWLHSYSFLQALHSISSGSCAADCCLCGWSLLAKSAQATDTRSRRPTVLVRSILIQHNTLVVALTRAGSPSPKKPWRCRLRVHTSNVPLAATHGGALGGFQGSNASSRRELCLHHQDAIATNQRGVGIHMSQRFAVGTVEHLTMGVFK